MRLICPNCGAQYAVADDVIPAAGRDVQCSNCAHTWFETPGASADDSQPPRRPRPTSTPQPGPYDGSIADAFKDAGDEVLAPAPQAPPKRKTVDPTVADILREEAERETAKRREESPSVENQNDLGLSDPPKDTRPAAPPDVREAAKTAASSTGAVAATAEGSRRELLPDIEEINSSLESGATGTSHAELSPELAEAQRRRSFRRGFFSVLMIIAILAAIYAQAEMIKTAVPAASDLLDQYVATVDVGRARLDSTIRGLLTSISTDTES